MTEFGQAEFGDLRADHAARLRILVEHHAMITERREVTRDGERGGAAADQRDALAVFLRRRLGQPRADIVLVIGGDALQAADRHRLVLDAHAPAGRLARPVTGAAENSRKHVGVPVDHVGVGIAARGDQPDIFRDGRMRRASPLAIHDLVEVARRRNVGILHSLLGNAPRTMLTRWRRVTAFWLAFPRFGLVIRLRIRGR